MDKGYRQNKNILIVSFYFPPYAEVSGVRALKLCKYLPENGWNPVVITVDERYYQGQVVAELPDEFAALRLLRLLFLPVPKARLFASLFFPFYVFYQVCKKRKKTDAICMIGSPYHPFILTFLFTRLLKIPTGLDFRDSWSNNFGYDGTARQNTSTFSRVLHGIFFLIERIGIRYASVVSFASPVLKKEYIEIHPRYKGKYHVVLNGYDPDDFENVESVSLAGGKTILLAGKFFTYTPEAVSIFFEILRRRDDLTFIYIGNEMKQIAKIALEQEVQDKVILKPYLPYKEVLTYIKGSDYCLLTNGVVNGVGTKIFDYLALRKPTLCLVPQGAALSDLFSDAADVLICERPFTSADLEEKLTRLFSLKPEKETGLDDRFSRKRSTKKFAEIYHEISK